MSRFEFEDVLTYSVKVRHLGPLVWCASVTIHEWRHDADGFTAFTRRGAERKADRWARKYVGERGA